MTLLRTFEDDEYLPEYGTLVVRDAWDADAGAGSPPGGEMLEEHATAAQPDDRSGRERLARGERER